MKKLIIIAMGCMLIANSLSAQWSYKWLNHYKAKHLLYTQGDMMVGSNSGGNLGLNFVYNNKYSVQVGYSATTNEFGSSVAGVLKSAHNVNPAELSRESNMTENYHVMVGRHFDVNSKGTIRFVLQGGPGMSVSMVPSQQSEVSNQDINSTGNADKTNEFSVILNSKFEIPISKTFGFSAGPTFIANQDRRFVTFGIGFMYGILSTN